MPPRPIVDPGAWPREVLLDLDAIRRHTPQRFEMEQLSAVTLIDGNRHLAIGYKDLSDREFWVKGHMPDLPLMPGVLMCEAVAQLCSVYCSYLGVMKESDFLGFAGLDNVRFRGIVRPGQRLWLVAHTPRHGERRMQFNTQGFIDESIVFQAELLGAVMSRAGADAPPGGSS